MSFDDNKLKKIHDHRQIGHMLLAAKEHQQTIYVWRIIGDKKIMAQVQFDLILPLRKEIRFSPKEESRTAFDHVVGGGESINFFLPHSALLFQAIVKDGHDEHGLTVTMPDFVALVERRNWLRMSTEEQLGIKVQFAKKANLPQPMNHFFGKSVNDLSAGGLSFLVNKHELRFLAEGESLKIVELILDGQKIKVSASVARIQELGRNTVPAVAIKSYKVSMKFDAIDKKDQEHLIKYIFQNLTPKNQAV